MKKIIVIFSAFVLMSGICFADMLGSVSSSGDLTSMSTRFSNGVGFGYSNAGGIPSSVLRWNPDFNLGNIGIGLDLNFVVGDKKDSNIETVVIRHVEYNTPGWGIKYGILKNITFGQGLLISNYTTVSKGGIIESNKQTGVKAYYKKDIYGVEVLGTWSKLYAARVTEDLNYLIPFTLGQYYVTDTDGVNFTKTDGTIVSYPSMSGAAIDAQTSFLFGSSLYAEYARLIGRGGGFTAGLAASTDIGLGKASLRAERRIIDYNFVPGYFNEDYETNPINLTSYEASSQSKDGYRVLLNTTVLNKGYIQAILEGYNGSNSALKADAYADISPEYFAAASFYQPNFQDSRSLNIEQGAIITTRLGYKVNQFSNVIVNYKKTYDPDQGKVVETQWYEFKIAF